VLKRIGGLASRTIETALWCALLMSRKQSRCEGKTAGARVQHCLNPFSEAEESVGSEVRGSPISVRSRET
jgi:hypothetical protein